MDQKDYQGVILVNSSLKTAFESIANGVPDWWTRNFEGSSQNVGDVFTTTFGGTFGTFKITEIIPNKKIEWYTVDCNLHFLQDKKEWKDTKILWKFEPKGDQVQITMTHIGLRPGIECFEDCTGGWNHYVKGSLYQLLTEGKGQPDHEDYSAKYKQ